MLDKKIASLADRMKDVTISRRRDLHAHPEPGWTEFRTAAMVAGILQHLGYRVQTGAAVVKEEEMMGVPSPAVLEAAAKQAVREGASASWVEKMQGGKTGVTAVFSFDRPGPVVALRFDMDANDVQETAEKEHRPSREGFSSVHQKAMHACGHDGHTAVGLAVAEILLELKDELCGSVKLIFQPAEEGVRGARAMVAAGVADDVDYMLGAHFGFKMKHTGQLAADVTGFLATSKFDAEFTGVPAHAGAAPETGKNALLAAACATLNLHAISRHGEGASRINVGTLQAGSGRNVIGDKALLKFETRGANSRINAYMAKEAQRILQAAATMYDVQVEIREMGGAAGASNTKELSERIRRIAGNLGIFNDLPETSDFGASEDFSYFMERVQEKGGQAAYIMVGADLAAGHHDSHFDFDENSLDLATKILVHTAVDLLTEAK